MLKRVIMAVMVTLTLVNPTRLISANISSELIYPVLTIAILENYYLLYMFFFSVQFSHSVVSDSL